MRPFVFAGGTAVVTGAASGIGEALAHGLAHRGSRLVLLDRDADRLASVAAAVQAVDTYVVDLADAAAAARTAGEILAAHPRIRLLVNNAGVALGGRFDQVTLDDFNWVIDINFRAQVTMTHVLLPALKAEPGAHLVNLSSIFGIVAPAGQSAYAASKFAVRGLTEVLRQELAADGIGVTCVHPGGIRTRITENARTGSGVSEAERAAGEEQWRKLLTIDPAVAAELILKAVRHRRGRQLIGWSARLPDLLARALPLAYGAILSAATGARRQPPATPAATPDGADARR
jgi:short-subunit dehydrogenase